MLVPGTAPVQARAPPETDHLAHMPEDTMQPAHLAQDIVVNGQTPPPRAARRRAVGANHPKRRRGLAIYIVEHAEEILRGWDSFAASVPHEGDVLDAAQLRDHGADIVARLLGSLQAQDAGTPATPAGGAAGLAAATASQLHADQRRLAGFTVDAVVAEYRALRQRVLQGWRQAGGGEGARDVDDVLRFDTAIDEALSEAVCWYVQQTRACTDLFIGILGHDIRNPLGTVFACAEHVVLSGQLSRASAAPIFNAATRIRAIVDQTMDFTRSQTHGGMPVRRSACRLAEQMERVVAETQARFPHRSLRLEVTGALEGQFDEGRLAQVLSNLLGNAINYGARHGAITVRGWETPADVCFSVHNHGVPIPPAERARVFEPLVRGNTALVERRSRSGLGLGLFICREIVRAHGGTIDVASTAHDGTTFTVRLPRRRPAPPAA